MKSLLPVATDALTTAAFIQSQQRLTGRGWLSAHLYQRGRRSCECARCSRCTGGCQGPCASGCEPRKEGAISVRLDQCQWVLRRPSELSPPSLNAICTSPSLPSLCDDVPERICLSRHGSFSSHTLTAPERVCVSGLLSGSQRSPSFDSLCHLIVLFSSRDSSLYCTSTSPSGSVSLYTRTLTQLLFVDT